MDPLIKNSLKAKYYLENFSKNLDSATSMDVISEITGKTVETKFVKYSDVNIGNNTQELAEPKVMANIFSLNPEEISTIIEGKKGLYIIQ
jgi:phage tail sheath protein FI